MPRRVWTEWFPRAPQLQRAVVSVDVSQKRVWIDVESDCKCRQIVRVDFPRAILNSRAVLTTESAASIRAEPRLGQFETRFASKTGSRALLYRRGGRRNAARLLAKNRSCKTEQDRPGGSIRRPIAGARSRAVHQRRRRRTVAGSSPELQSGQPVGQTPAKARVIRDLTSRGVAGQAGNTGPGTATSCRGTALVRICHERVLVRAFPAIHASRSDCR